MNDLRVDQRDKAWPFRPWLMAALCSFAGLFFWVLVEAQTPSTARLALASALAVATIAFVLTVEWRRWLWALGFGLSWGAIIGLIAYTNGSYGRLPSIFEWPFFAGIFAVLIAAPLFQSLRDHGGWRFPASLAHDHVWTDAVIGAVAILFIGVSFAMTLLIGGLFNLIGIDFIEWLFDEGWFPLMLAGAAFGGAVGLLRERDALVVTIHRLAMVVLGVLAPVMAAALLLFLLSLPITGLSGLWDSWASAAALTLAAGAGAMVLANAALGYLGDGRDASPLMRGAALVLTLAILPLAVLAMTAMALRVGQYGWTPERIWGVLAAAVGIGFGAAGWWAVARRRFGFAPYLQQLQVWIAMAVCALALVLALPLVDFGAISARDQLARLQSGAVSAEDFDYAAMAFDFGPAGRESLLRLARTSESPRLREQARLALRAEYRHQIGEEMVADVRARLNANMRIEGGPTLLPLSVRERIGDTRLCNVARCAVRWLDDRRIVVVGRRPGSEELDAQLIVRTNDGGEDWATAHIDRSAAPPGAIAGDPMAVTIRPVTRQQLLVGGHVFGDLPPPPR
jgi:hypothetical protein